MYHIYSYFVYIQSIYIKRRQHGNVLWPKIWCHKEKIWRSYFLRQFYRGKAWHDMRLIEMYNVYVTCVLHKSMNTTYLLKYSHNTDTNVYPDPYDTLTKPKTCKTEIQFSKLRLVDSTQIRGIGVFPTGNEDGDWWLGIKMFMKFYCFFWYNCVSTRIRALWKEWVLYSKHYCHNRICSKS